MIQKAQQQTKLLQVLILRQNLEYNLLSNFIALYQNKLQEQGVQNVANRHKTKFEPYGD